MSADANAFPVTHLHQRPRRFHPPQRPPSPWQRTRLPESRSSLPPAVHWEIPPDRKETQEYPSRLYALSGSSAKPVVSTFGWSSSRRRTSAGTGSPLSKSPTSSSRQSGNRGRTPSKKASERSTIPLSFVSRPTKPITGAPRGTPNPSRACCRSSSEESGTAPHQRRSTTRVPERQLSRVAQAGVLPLCASGSH